jgi:hypothetical protein
VTAHPSDRTLTSRAPQLICGGSARMWVWLPRTPSGHATCPYSCTRARRAFGCREPGCVMWPALNYFAQLRRNSRSAALLGVTWPSLAAFLVPSPSPSPSARWCPVRGCAGRAAQRTARRPRRRPPDRVRRGCPDRGAGDADVDAGEDRVEGGGECAVAVADQELEQLWLKEGTRPWTRVRGWTNFSGCRRVSRCSPVAVTPVG